MQKLLAIGAITMLTVCLLVANTESFADTKQTKEVKKDTKKTTNDVKKTTKPETKTPPKATPATPAVPGVSKAIPATPSTGAYNEVTIEMAKGSGGNTKCDIKCYVPNKVNLKKGGTVTWVNKDTMAHTATSGTMKTGPDGKFDTGLVNAGGKYTTKITEVGKYDYLCIVHPWMKGTIEVK